MSEHAAAADPCGDYGPTQRWATVWFFAVLAIGMVAVFIFRNTDYFMYHTNAEFYNYSAFQEARQAQYNIRSDSVDERSQGDYATAVQHISR